MIQLDEAALRAAAPIPGGAPHKSSRPTLRILREPLLHFLVVGLAIFLGAQTYRRSHDERRIVVTPAVAASLAEKYRLQFGAPPTAAQRDDLVRRYVDEEVLYRDGMAQGLDRNDEIVRRRVAQKAQFLRQGLTTPVEQTEAAVRDFYQAHRANYAVPERFTFSHLFFSPDRGGEAAARSRAVAALGPLQAGASPQSVPADVFSDLSAYADISVQAAARVFGASELPARLAMAPVGRWAGPYRSGYGWHLLHVDSKTPARRPDLAAIHDRVKAESLDAAQAAANDRSFATLRRRYTVVREDVPRPRR